MTSRQQAFAQQYVTDHNGAAAAVRAGYAVNSARVTASQLLAKPNVLALVAEHEAAAAERLAVSRERVIAELEKAIDEARTQRNPMAMIAGWREIAKICGFYAPERRQIEVGVDVWKVRAHFEAMSDAELLAIIGENERQASPNPMD